jgi:hypothetical protein
VERGAAPLGGLLRSEQNHGYQVRVGVLYGVVLLVLHGPLPPRDTSGKVNSIGGGEGSPVR